MLWRRWDGWWCDTSVNGCSCGYIAFIAAAVIKSYADCYWAGLLSGMFSLWVFTGIFVICSRPRSSSLYLLDFFGIRMLWSVCWLGNCSLIYSYLSVTTLPLIIMGIEDEVLGSKTCLVQVQLTNKNKKLSVLILLEYVSANSACSLSKAFVWVNWLRQDFFVEICFGPFGVDKVAAAYN